MAESFYGILLLNTGSPDHPTPDAVNRYLRQFLMDRHILNLPLPLRYLLVNRIIVPKRAVTSAERYQQIWTKNGSPLTAYSTSLATRLQERISAPVKVGMRYGNPSISSAIQELEHMGADRLCVVPLFPQFAMATYGSTMEQVEKETKLPIRSVPPFFDHPAYIEALASTLPKNNDPLLFTYHGLPERYIQKDPTYRIHCEATTNALIQYAGLKEDQCFMAYQSRLGPTKWMKPYTDQRLRELPKQDVRNLNIISPAFFCDGLETLEELGIEGREIFLTAGGQTYTLLPCLNDTQEAVDCLSSLIQDAIA